MGIVLMASCQQGLSMRVRCSSITYIARHHIGLRQQVRLLSCSTPDDSFSRISTSQDRIGEKKQALLVVTRGSSPSVKAKGLYNKDGIELNPQNVDEPTVIPSIDKTAIEVVEAHLNGNHN